MPREPPIVLPVSLPLLGHANPWALLLAKEEGYWVHRSCSAEAGPADAMLTFLRARR